MIDQSAARILHPLEVRIILAFDEGEIIDSQRVKQVLGFREGQEQQAFSWLLAKGVLEEAERSACLPIAQYLRFCKQGSVLLGVDL